MRKIADYLKVHMKKIAPGSLNQQKQLCRRGLSLLLAALLLVTVIDPLFGLFAWESKATSIYYEGNSLDNSTGNKNTAWYTPGDATQGASKDNPYIIQNADQLAGLAELVNNGTNFEGKYIRLKGLTKDEAAALQGTNKDATPGVIDLRKYNGSTGTTTSNYYWVPIGKTETKPFKGTLYAENDVSVINLNFASEESGMDCFGLVGYNEGTVEGFTISYTAFGESASVKTGLNFTKSGNINVASLKYIGSAVAYNKGTVKNITVGVGGQVYNQDKTFSFNKEAVINSQVTLGATAIAAFGGVVGASYGTIDNCSFYGSTILSTVNLSINGSQFAYGAVGGIAGTAGESEKPDGYPITNCVADVDMRINTIGQYNGYGGIVGKTRNCKIENCIAYGSISAENVGNDTDNQFGGIGGRLDAASNISKCISAVDINVKRYSTKGYENNAVCGAVGGIAGTLINSTINESFSIGNLSSMTAVGGLVGNLAEKDGENASVTNCYSSCAVTIGINETKDNGIGESTGYWDAGVHAAGGLVGYVGNKDVALSNCYFSGSTLKSEIGSVFGSVAGDAAISSSFTNVYFDKQVSPNRAAGAYRGADKDVSGFCEKSTADLQAANILDANTFVISDGQYPALQWVQALSGKTAFDKLAKAFSEISTKTYINLTQTYGSAYTAHEVGASSNVLTKPTSSSAVTYGENWIVKKEYIGVQEAKPLGGVYSLSTVINDPVGGAYTCNVSRKLLLPVNTSSNITEANANFIPDAVSFKRFLDIAAVASGAYIGGVFTLSQNIDETIQVQSVSDQYNYNGLLMMDNLFCATLDGQGNRIGGIETVGVTTGMLGSALSGTVQNLTVGNIIMGTNEKPYSIPKDAKYTRIGLLFSRIKFTTIQNIIFNDINVVLDNGKTQCTGFGILAGYNPGGSQINQTKSLIADIKVNNANVLVMNLGSTSENKADSLMYMGLLAGELHGATVQNNSIQKLTFDTKLGIVRSIGSFIGAMPEAADTISNCSVKDLEATIGGTKNFSNNYHMGGFGGIIGHVAGVIRDCAVQGKITSNFTTTSNVMENRAGGITVFGSNSKKIENCTFVGSITDFGCSGGLVAYANHGYQINNSSVVGDIKASEKYASSVTYSGGLIGDMSASGNKISNSYFMGNVTGHSVGSFAGLSNGTFEVKNSYAKAIVKGTSATGYVGGLVGQSKGNLTVTSSYFAGQLRGEGMQGAFAADAPGTTCTNAYFDRSIAGANIATISSVTTSDAAAGAALDEKCAKLTEEITAAELGTAYQAGNDNYYPSHSDVIKVGSIFIDDTTKATLKNVSTKKVFLVQQDTDKTKPTHSLVTQPYFKLETSNVDTGVTVTVTPKSGQWEIVKLAQGSDTYIPETPGSTTATVTYTGIDPAVLPTLNMVYDIMFVPFDYGTGTKADPYIIYDAKELKKFKDFVDSGFDTANIYYKIGSVDEANKKVIGDPITIDLQDTVFGGANSEWQSILNFQGNLDGNNSVLENLKQTTPTIDNSNAEYVGLFATSSGRIENLTLNHVELTPQFTDINASYGGPLVAYATGGSYIGCHVLNDVSAAANDINLRQPNQISGAAATAVGGLIGYLNITASSESVVQGCTVLADISFTGNVGNGIGGVIGYANLFNVTSSLKVDNTASYGSASVNKTSLGGIVGGTNSLIYPVQITNCVSTMDLTVKTTDSLLGGLFAGNKKKETANNAASVTFDTCYYGGKLSYPEEIKAVGGISAVSYLYQDLSNRGYIPKADLDKGSLFYKGALYDNAEELGKDVDQLLRQANDGKGLFTNCAYNYNVNHVPVAFIIMRCQVNYTENNGTKKNGPYTFDNESYGSFSDVTTARSTTQEMTNGKTDTADFMYEKGYYPIPTRLYNAGDDPNGKTEQNEAYMNYMARFYSAAVYYTNADKFGDNTYSNIYLLSQSGANIGEKLDTAKITGATSQVTVTNNGKMVQSTDNASATVTVPLVGEYTSAYKFIKNIEFKPSVVACGVSDSSYVYANPEGMWVTTEGAVKYPWTIYTADQLQGFTSVVNNIPDGNAIVPDIVDYNGVTIPVDEATSGTGVDKVTYIKGDTFAIGHDLDGSNYEVFAPVCPDNTVKDASGDISKPFDSQLNGLGHVITNLNITRAVGDGETAPTYTKLGLFGQANGAELKNFGLVNPYSPNKTNGVLYDSGAAAVGSIAASIKNSKIQNCFSALPVIGKGKESQPVGGLVGEANGINTISGSFFTGVLYTEADSGQTAPALGGLLGNAVNGKTTVTDSYLAGFLQTTGETAAIAPAGTVEAINCYYDLNATGDLSMNNGAIPAELDDIQPAGFKSIGKGFYPLQQVFKYDTMSPSYDNIGIALRKIYLTNARSATSGYVIDYSISRVPKYNEVISEGTITQAPGDVSRFTKSGSGFIFLNIGRLVAADLRCWYDNPKTENDKTVYTINTAKELLEFSKIVNGDLTANNNPNGQHMHETVPFSFEKSTVRLGSDIDLSDLGEGFAWEAIGTQTNLFQGSFDGNGHVITLRNTTGPLFGVVEGAVIQNLGLNGSIDAPAPSEFVIAPLAGTVKGNSTVTSCFSAVQINNAAKAASLVGELSNGSSLLNSFNMGSISGNGELAGLVFTNNGTIENCYNVGVISSLGGSGLSGSAAGIALHNSGSVTNCFNASYVSAENKYAVANGEAVKCAYDSKLMESPLDAANLTKGISSDFGSIENWVKGSGAFYPQLSVFAGDAPFSDKFKTVSALSALILNLTGTDYKEFSSATIFSQANGQTVELDAANYEKSLLGNEYTLTNSGGATGPQTVVTAAAGFTHHYYTTAQATMKIRYKFDFSKLFNGTPKINDNYHVGGSVASSTWAHNDGTTFKISTAEDFNAFIAYVNDGKETKGKTFKLNYNIDFGNQELSAIKVPFNGTFDGGYYTLSNFKIFGKGAGALFSEIGETGRVENLSLSGVNVEVDLLAGAAETYGAVIAVNNKGFIGNMALTDCVLEVNNNDTTSSSSYVGMLAAQNSGRITGCYARSTTANVVLTTNDKSPDYSGSLVGYNLKSGSLSGCYFVGDMRQIYLIAGTNAGQIFNCYYSAANGQEPEQAKGAYRSSDALDGKVLIDNYWLTHAQMKTSEFASWLSSNIYGGAYDVGTDKSFVGGEGGSELNGGFPYLTGFELVKYDLASYFHDKSTMLLSVWNMAENNTTPGSISNGIFALDNLQFKYFSDIIVNARLEFNMHELPNGIDYLVSNARVYGKDAQYKEYEAAPNKLDANILKDFKGENWNKSLTAQADAWKDIDKPNLVVVTIQFRGKAQETPWGNYRTWSSTNGIEQATP